MSKKEKTPPPAPLLRSVDDSAAILGLSRANLYRKINSGDIASVQIGSRRMIPQYVLDGFTKPAA